MENNYKKPKRTAAQREIDAAFCFNLYLQGQSMRKICKRFNEKSIEDGRNYTISTMAVHKDIKMAIADYRSKNDELIEEQVHIELARLNRIEAEMWDAWESSKAMRRRTKIKGGTIEGGQVSGGTLSERQMEEMFGNPQYLKLVLDCVDRRCRLLGIDKPQEFEGKVSIYEYMKKLADD